MIRTINPATGQIIQSYTELGTAEAIAITDSIHTAFLQWRHTRFSERTKKLQKVAELLRANKHRYAQLITQEMGKPIRFSIAEIEKCAWSCEYFAENAETLLARQPVSTGKNQSYILYAPLGVIFAIMPWNFPFWQVFRCIAPNLMAGNAIVLRHAPNTTGCGLAIEALLQEAELPVNIMRTLIISNDTATEVIRHAHVKGVTLTGSPRAGRAVGSAAAGALKKVVLELGGNDPYIILADADLEKAAQVCVTSRLNNSGQVCIAAKRLIAVEAIYEKFAQEVIARVKNYRMGDPTSPETDLGPLARADLRDTVHQQVVHCVQQGATLMTGGAIPDQPGFYYPPTILKNVTVDMPAMREEIFGPVIALIKAKDETDAIRIANDSEYGLAAAVFTQDISHGETIAAQQLQAGTCSVNDLVSSDPRLPFGGINHSGFGRELGEAGIREFTNIKTVIISQ